MNLDYLNEGLLEQIEQAFKEIRENAYAEGYKQGRYDAEMDAIHTLPIPNKPTSTAASISEKFFIEPQAKRDEIIEKAKRDVAELLSGDAFDYHYGDFVVNREKRTIVALLKPDDDIIYREVFRGIAKCAPDDCFNSAIGKAIALRRALGLEVPSEYLNAPQPTEVRVGDVINYYDTSRGNLTVVDDCEYSKAEYDTDDYTAFSTAKGHALKIIDDSRDGEAE